MRGRIPERVVPYVEPARIRHAIARREIWILRELAENDESRYDIGVYDQRRCIFFHIPKTAGLAVTEALFGNRGAGHIDVQTARLVFGASKFKSYFKFTFVRNPWDRVVSAYHYLHAGHPKSPIAYDVAACKSFEEFVVRLLKVPGVVEEQHLRPQFRFVTDAEGKLAVDFVGRFERLTEDFATVAARVGTHGPLAPANASSHADFRCYYSDLTRDIVGEIYQRDLELFGYAFEGL